MMLSCNMRTAAALERQNLLLERMLVVLEEADRIMHACNNISLTLCVKQLK